MANPNIGPRGRRNPPRPIATPWIPNWFRKRLPLASAYTALYGSVREKGEYRKLWQRLHWDSGLQRYLARIGRALVAFTRYFFFRAAHRRVQHTGSGMTIRPLDG